MSKKAKSYLGTGILTFISIWWVMPVLIVLFNSFKSKVWISQEPFTLPNVDNFIGLENYQEAIKVNDELLNFFAEHDGRPSRDYADILYFKGTLTL